MSSTNRGAARRPADYYPTPAWAVRALLRALDLPFGASVLDPCAGDGAILRVARGMIEARCVAIELEERHRGPLQVVCDGAVHIADALDFPEMASIAGVRPVVITNPPFSLMREFIGRWAVNRMAAFLLPSSYFRGQKHASWWQGKEPGRLLQLPRRPAFVAVCKGLSATKTRKRQKGCGRSYPLGLRGVCECGGNISDGTDSQDYVWALWGFDGPPIQVLTMEMCQ